MSAINKALSELTPQHEASTQAIQKASIPKSNRTPALAWVGVGFAMSLAMGGWAISQANAPASVSVITSTKIETEAISDVSMKAKTVATIPSPTASTDQSPVAVYPLPKVEAQPIPETIKIASAPTVEQSHATAVTLSAVTESQVNQTLPAIPDSSIKKLDMAAKPKPLLVANVTRSDNSIGNMIIEQVELTPQELANKAVTRAKKSLDSNDIGAALAHYEDALRYTANNEQVRQQLAALYYGKGQTNKAYQLLEEGINRNVEGETLRIALSKLLIKEQQQEAALTPLVFLPSQASQEYLALRAGLAQRNKQTDLAYESYRLLTEKDRNNARWWMGLAIQQERKMEFSQAKDSYQKSLSMIGISSQSKAFIRDRLKVLASLEGSSDAN